MLKLPRTGLTGSTALSEVVRITLDGCIGILLDVLDYRLSHKCPNLSIVSSCCWRTQVLPFSPVHSLTSELLYIASAMVIECDQDLKIKTNLQMLSGQIHLSIY